MTRRQVSRRGFLGGAAALGAAGLVRPADAAAGRNGHHVGEAEAALAALLARAGTPATTSARRDAVACCG